VTYNVTDLLRAGRAGAYALAEKDAVTAGVEIGDHQK
jgi:hypothetical protein